MTRKTQRLTERWRDFIACRAGDGHGDVVVSADELRSLLDDAAELDAAKGAADCPPAAPFCPRCAGNLSQADSRLICTSCGTDYKADE